MTTNEIIKSLKEKETDFLKIESFSKNPGIYAIFYIGDNFPLIGESVSKHQLIYIGKTESSQERRDAKTHFTTGKTGSSTVRKSLGSILFELENLKPIPRNATDYKSGRFSHFRFDSASEEKITNWMTKNLSLSFYELPRTRQEIEYLETEIIIELVPILNISKNPNNPFKDTLESLRKNCAVIASKVIIPEVDRNNQIRTPILKEADMITSIGKYTDLWTKYRTQIKEKLYNASTKQSIQLNSNDFKDVGNRKDYSFNLEFINGTVSNNINGSAVARDLANVLQHTDVTIYVLQVGHFKINMDKQFCLRIEKK